MELRRFWIEFEPPAEKSPTPGYISLDEADVWSRWLWRGCGVSAYDEADALKLIQAMAGEDLPPVTSVVADVAVDVLPEYARGAGVVVWRGVWYPPANLRGPRSRGDH